MQGMQRITTIDTRVLIHCWTPTTRPIAHTIMLSPGISPGPGFTPIN